MATLGETGLVYGVCVGPSGKFERITKPALEQLDPTAPILTRRDQRSIHRAYNSLLVEAQSMGARGLVLIHDDAAIRNPTFPTALLELFAQGDVGVVGAVGARGVLSIEWWWYERFGFVEEPDFTINWSRETTDVDAVDGVALALSPEAIRQLRFDEERYPPFHGYDFHISAMARSKGLRVVVTDMDLFHDSSPHGKITDEAAHARADRAWRKQWRPGLGNSLRYRKAVLTSNWRNTPQRVLRAVRP